MEKDIWDRMRQSWGSELVARTEIERFTGGLLSCKYLANLDSSGQGPVRMRLGGRKVGYPILELIQWLRERSNK